MNLKRSSFFLATLMLLSSASWSQSSSVLNNLQRTRPMSSEQQITAFFYKQPVVLDRETHKDLRIKPGDAMFAKNTQAVPLLVTEFPEACLEYPIVFSKGNGGQWLALAMTGLTQNHNAFVDAKGVWNARYVPASVRRYPFILAEGNNKELSLAADLSAPQLGKEGDALFDDKGQPTEVVKGVMNLLAEFQGQAKLTEAVVQKFEDAGLLTQQNLEVRLGDGRNAVVEGVWIIDEKKMRELPDDKILSWFKGGELTAMNAQMLSLRNLLPLLERVKTEESVDNDKKQAPRKK